jgi:hypothetical protein
MTEPPDDEGPDERPQIVEPPFNPETDTRPLKPLRSPESGESSVAPMRPRRRPATILREASAEPPRPLLRIAPVEPDDTSRVRPVPKLPEPPPWRLILTTTTRKPSIIGLDVRETLVIGRIDPEGDQNPDFDLTPHHALEHGVSRQHAVLIPTGEALYLVDLDSTNGTWINGGYLEPGQRHPLTAGDRVELGLLRLAVKSVSQVSRG